MSDWGIKVSKSGAAVTSSDIRDILMSSKFPMLKYYSDNSGNITVNPGDTESSIDFTHSLGYVPAFLTYFVFNNKLYFFFNQFSVTGTGRVFFPYSFSDSSKVRAGIRYTNGAYNRYDNRDSVFNIPPDGYTDIGGTRGLPIAGNFTTTPANSAFRFTGVSINQATTIVSATINFYVGGKGSGTGDMKIKTYGIAEDNTGDFSSNPLGRSKTTAVTTQNVASITTGQYFGINVTSQVQEIINRGGWANGNAVGFIINDNGSPNDVYAADLLGSTPDSYLQIVYGSSTTYQFRTIIFRDRLV